MTMPLHRQKQIYAAFVCTVFFLYLWIAVNIPMFSYDDWKWGSDLGLQYLVTAADNSRYCGNLLVVVLTRSRLLRALVMASVFTAIPGCMTVFVMEYLQRFHPESAAWPMKPLLFLTANVLVFLLPPPVWSQTYGWVAGFCNYITSGLLLILYFLFVMRLDRAPAGEGRSTVRYAVIFACGVGMQLFLENVSAFFFMTSLFLVLRRVLKKQKPEKELLVLLLGNALGLVLVFSSAIYPELFSTGEAVAHEGVSYRKLLFDPNDGPLKIVGRLLSICYYDRQPAMIDYSGVLPPAILAVMLLYGLSGSRIKNRSAGLLLLLLHAVPFAYTVYRVLFLRFEIWIPFIERIDAVSENLFYFSYLANVTADLFLFFRKDPGFPWLLGIWVSPIVIIAPMSAIDTVGERSFISTTLCYQLFLMLLLPPLWHAWKPPLRKMSAAAAAICCLVLSAYFVHIYYDIGRVNRQRLSDIEEARLNSSETVYLVPFPHEQYVFVQNPYNEYYKLLFTSFHKLPPDIRIEY